MSRARKHAKDLGALAVASAENGRSGMGARLPRAPADVRAALATHDASRVWEPR